MERATLTVHEAAEMLGISPRHAYLMARQGELPVLRLGNRWLIVRARLEEMLARSGGDVEPTRIPIVEA